MFKNIPYLIKNTSAMLKQRKIFADKLLWRVMADSGMRLDKEYDMAIAYLEGGSTDFVHDHVKAKQKLYIFACGLFICRLQQKTG